MATCSRCGEEISFRYIDGRCVPIHKNGGWACTGISRPYALDGYQRYEQSCSHLTTCIHCGKSVFFIRHNNGCVWIDPPLGPPWEKHSCFYTQDQLGVSGKILSEVNITKDSMLGVVESIRVTNGGTSTNVNFIFGKNEEKQLQIKYNAAFLLGRLCVWNKHEQVIFPSDCPQYRFVVCDKDNEWARCKVCKVWVKKKNLSNHLRKQHGYDEPLSKSSSCAF